MRQHLLLVPILILVLLTACETPSDSFERVNTNDPASPIFAGGTVTGLRAAADSSGLITLRWPSADNSVDKHIIEKSLGDSLSFSPIAELDPAVRTFVDTSRDVRMETYYRLSSYMELDGEGEVLYGSTDTKLEFGAISAVEYEFLEESDQLKLMWSTDVPFFTHFIISSDHAISDQQESTVKIPASTNKHSFQDPLLDVDFETRTYTITGVIENDGVDESGPQRELVFNSASFFRPQNAQINIMNEQDWEISWDSRAFFATEVELIRPTFFDDIVINLPSDTRKYTDSQLLDDSNDSRVNRSRRYRLKFLSEGGESEWVELGDGISIDRPVIAISNIPQNDPNSLIIYGAGFGDDKDLIKEYIIEKPHSVTPDRFVEVGRADGGRNFQFTDTDVSGTENPIYRVRTVTSIPSRTASFAYSYDYDLDYEFDVEMNQVTSVEISSDKKFLAATSFRSEQENSVVILDINNRQKINEITIPNQQISDVKISQDDQSIYMAVPTDKAIYKADFPSGDNIQKIIGDAFVNSRSVLHFDISADNTFIAGTGGRGFVKKWSLETLDSEFIFAQYNTPTSYPYKNVAISPDGKSILANNGLPLLLDSDDGSLIETLPWVDQYILDHQFSSDGDYMAFTSGARNTHIYETENLNRTDMFGKGQRADFHPEKNILLISSRYSVYTYNVETSSILDVISSGNGNKPYHQFENKVTFIDDERVGTVSGMSTIQIWKKSGSQRRWKNVVYN